MVLVVFRSSIRPENEADFFVLAEEMEKLATAMPGFVSYKVFKAEDGERCSIIEFETEEELRAWRTQAEHAQAQKAGRERFYSEYSLQIGVPSRESRFTYDGS
jgi:heme-degrading monooxygenase HmoA